MQIVSNIFLMQLYVWPCCLIQKYIAALFYLVDSYIYNDVKKREMYKEPKEHCNIGSVSQNRKKTGSTLSAARLDPSKCESRRKN